MNGADLIANILKAEGIELVPAFPHSDLIDAVAKLGMRPLIVRQERHALHIADGYARTTGGRRICCTTVQYGPGSENAVGALAQCYADNVPVLHMPGGYALGDQGAAPNFNAARNTQLVSKWSEMVLRAERIPEMMQNAFARLRNGRPGPVLLEVPIDIFSGAVDAALLESYRPQRRSAPAGAREDVRQVVDMLLGAKSPLIVAGQGILYAGAWDELRQLAELTQTPVMSTLNGKSAFPENHPLSLGCAGASRPDSVVRFLDKADLILGLGTSFSRSDYITPFPTKGRTFAQLTNWEGNLAKDYPLDFGLVGDAKPTIAAIVARATEVMGESGRRPESAVADEIAALKAAYLKQWRPLLESDTVPINPYRVVNDLMASVDRSKTVVTHDAGSPRDQMTAFFEALTPFGYMGWGKTTQLGMGLGLMQGAKLARPDWNCINVCGDAAIGMVGMDIETAVRNRIGTTTIVLKNAVMGGYREYHPSAAEEYAIHELGGDYADMAKSLGAHGERVEAPAEIKPAIARALERNAEGSPALLEVITAEEPRMAKKLPSGID
jgi:acetolactate synthase-1/2/3 large subunit